ncbi:MAG: alginate export family protein [Pseudomonadota bacterium]
MFHVRSLRCMLAVSLLVLPLIGTAEPWRVQDQWTLPEWLSVSGDHQLRYEWLDETFRSIDPGADDVLLSRLLLAVEATVGNTVRFGAELQDTRTWGAETRTPLNSTFVNALEPLQLYMGLTLPNVLGEDGSVDVRVGRFTMQMGSNRFVARHIFRNALQAHTGVNVLWTQDKGPRLQLFATNPVRRLPLDAESLRDNDVEFDEDTRTLFWGAHLDRLRFGTADAAVYVFGIDDSDTVRRPSLNRNYVTAGVRLLSDEDNWYWELETAYQFGSIRGSLSPGDLSNLDHRAWLVHADVGWRLKGSWSPVAELRFDYASGDDNPSDASNERFDTLVGPLRFDYGPTSIYNLVRRQNSNTTGLYLTLTPREDTAWMTGYRAAWLAIDRDRLSGSLLRDPDGGSGSFLGHQIETRYRWDLRPGNLRLEFGGAYLFKGEFLKDAPQAPETGNTIYLYTQLTTTF